MRAFHLGKLNGWQRIGVILSAGWFLFLTANAVSDYVDIKNSSRYAGNFFSRELSDEEVFGKVAPSVPPTKADAFLDGNVQGKNPFDRFDKTPRPVIHFKFDKFLALALIPVVSAWIGVYLIVWVARWVIAGFKRT